MRWKKSALIRSATAETISEAVVGRVDVHPERPLPGGQVDDVGRSRGRPGRGRASAAASTPSLGWTWVMSWPYSSSYSHGRAVSAGLPASVVWCRG